MDASVSIAEKAEHVRSQMREAREVGHRDHHCHWPGCTKQVPPAQWGCTGHWKMLPPHLRNDIWRAYRPGQEISLTPSDDYMTVAHQVQEWILANHPPNPAQQARKPELPKPAEQSHQASLF